MTLLRLCFLGLVGVVVSDVSVEVPASECQAGDQECEESALLQFNTKPKCKPIKEDCGMGKGKGKKVAGFLYTALNGEKENKVVVFDRHKDGTLGRQRVYLTGGLGGSNKSASGGLQGDYDAQGGMQIIGEYLLVVNGGDGSVTVFFMCEDGSLTKVEKVSSGGKRPVSIAYYPKKGGKGPKGHKGAKGGGGGDEYWVVVGNQWGNPVILGDPESKNLQFYPNEAYHLDHEYEKNNPDLNIFLFSFDSGNGKLTPERLIESYPGTWGGPCTVGFNEDGTKLGLTTWGIAHDGTAKQIQKLLYQKPSRLYVYDFDDGKFTNKRYWESCGDSGFVGFSWLKDRLMTTSFNAVNAHGLKVIKDNGKRLTLEQEFVADMESCWTHFLNPSVLYVANFLANTITQFDVDSEGKVSSQVANVDRKNLKPPGDTKEMWTDSAEKNFYVQGTGFSFTIAWYSIKEGGKLVLNEEIKVKELIGAANYSSNLLGIAGYEYCPEKPAQPQQKQHR